MVYYIPKLEKDTSIKTGYGNTLSNPGTVSLNNNVTLSNLTQKNTNTTTNKPNYYVLKGMQNGTINKNNLMSYMTPAQNTQYTVKPNITEMLENSYDYLEQKYKQSDDYRLVQQDKKFVDKHPQAMTEEGWIDRQRALNAGNTELAKQIEEQDKAKRTQNWNDWWNSEAEVKKRQERTDKYNKEQEKKQKEYDARIPESIKKIQKFADETKNDIAMQGAREYVKELTQTMGENEIADYLDNYLYIQGFASGTKSGWWSDYSAYDDLKEDLKALIEENGGVIDIENASKLAKYIKDATGYELPADGVGETLWRGAKSLGKNTAKGITKVGDSVVTGWSMAYTGAKNAITGSNDKYRQYNSWDDLNAELNGEIYRKEYKDPSLQNAWSNALSGGAGLAQVAQTVYFPVINYVFDTAGETQVGRDLFSNKYAGTAIGAVIGAVATKGKWTGIGAGAGIGSVPTLVDKAVEEYAGDMSEEDKENLKGLITDGFFTALGVKQTGNNYKPVKGAIETVKNTPETIKNTAKAVKEVKDNRVANKATKATNEALVTEDFKSQKVANANKNIDIKNVKTYKDWSTKLDERIKTASKEVDSMLSKEKTYNLSDFKQTTKSGKTEINHIENALKDMKRMYEDMREYDKMEKVENYLSGKEKLSEVDINNLAREYGQDFNAWLKNGNLSQSASKQGYENTRMGIKKWLRENTENGMKAEKLDTEMSDIYDLKRLVDKRAGNVAQDKIRSKRSFGGKIVDVITNPISVGIVGNAIVPGYGLGAGLVKVLIDVASSKRGGNRRSDAQIEKTLNKNLKKIQKLSEQLKKKEITEKQAKTALEDLLSNKLKRSKFLKKKTKTEAKKLSEPKVKGLLTEGKKLLKKGEKTENKAKSETKPLKKSEEKVEKKVVNEKKVETKEEKTKSVLKNAPKTNSKGEDIERFTSKTDEALKKRKKDIESYFNRANENITRLLEKYPELEKNIEKKNQILNKADKDAVDQIIANFTKNTPKEESLLISKDGLKGSLIEYRLLENEFKRRGLDFTDEFSSILKKPKKLKAKKLEKPKKESEILNGKTVGGESYEVLVENYRKGTLNSKEGLIDLYIKGLIKKGNLELENPNMIESLKTQLIKRKERNGGNTSYTKSELIQKINKDLGISKNLTFGDKIKSESKPLKKETKPLKKVEEVKVEEKIETLPKDVSIESEAKQMGNKRIAPDRVKWQQLKYEDGVSNMQDSVNKLANYLQSKKRTVEAIGGGIDSYLRLMPTGRYNSVSGFLEKIGFKSKQGKEFKTLVQNIVEADGNKTIINEIGKHLYITRVKGDISKGYQYPQEVVDKIPGAKKAIDNRERYQKGLDTSFSAKDARIDYSDVDKIGAGIKSQDGKQITKEQRENIVKGIQDFEKVFGVDLKQLAKDEGIVYVDLHGGNPFLNKAGGQYTTLTNADGTVNKSVSVGGSEIYRYKDANGEWQTEKVSTTMAHELTHFLDLYSEKRLLTDKEVSELRKTMIRDGKTWGKGKSYWNDPAEITARAFEEYFGMKKGGEGSTRGKGVKFTEHGYYWNEKNFKEIVKPIVEKAIKNFKDRMEVKIEDLPF